MDKLIELLNEYEKDGVNEFETYVERWYCERTYQILSGKWENSNELKPCEIISKRYGFIKWLVENEKIDVKEIGKIGMTKMKGEPTSYMFDKIYSDLESLLMLLSIQDEPIEFLVSILK